MSQLDKLLQQCTVKVKISLPSGIIWGTGFFVAPGLILTCHHVVRKANGQPVQVQRQQIELEAVVERSLPDPHDLALLRVSLSANYNPPCVYLDEEVKSRDPLYLFGYPDEGDREGEPRTFNCNGITGSEIAFIFNGGQVRPGMSGSPLLNHRTGKVCGIVKFTRDRFTDMGGGAILANVILEQFPQLREWQQEFHQRDKRWSNLVAELPRDETINPTNSGVPSYRTQTGMDNTNFIGGVHHHNHHLDSSPVDQTVKKILILSANPQKAELPNRTEEIKTIRAVLKKAFADSGNSIEINSVPGIDATNLSQELSAIKPYIIDIFGSEAGIESLVIEQPFNDAGAKNEKTIGEFFEFYTDRIECVILNGCYSDSQAKEIAQHISFVIGINRKLEDTEIIKFLDDFYYHLGSKETIELSYKIGCNRLKRSLKLENHQLFPILLGRNNERQRRKLEEKLKSCNTQIELNEDSAELWKEKAKLLRDLGHSEEADKAYEKASSLDPENHKLRTEQGDASEELGNHEKAVQAYDKALELEEKDYTIWWKKGKALANAKKYSEAQEPYEYALILAPPSPDNYVICREYGSILYNLEQFSKSVELYKKSLGTEPRHRVSSYEKRKVYKRIYFG